MFLPAMKYVVSSLAMLSIALFSFAQNDAFTNTLTNKLPQASLFYKAASDETIDTPIFSKSDSITDIRSEYWDTTVYNPFKSIYVQYPIRIKFTDSMYSPPISRKKVITSRYGWRGSRPHKGIDIDLVTGDSVVSVLGGIVRFAQYSSGHGKAVIVRHYNGLETTYSHLSHIAVQPNDSITKGQYLGNGGNTGNSTGSHLHFETSYKGEYIHPEYLFDFTSDNTLRAQEIWLTQQWTRPIFHNSKRMSHIDLLTSYKAALDSLIKQKKVYVVRAGDTLYDISKRNNVPISSICNANAIKKSSPLKIGQKLVLEL
jgi:murein DD-endopeptidase MepM/ murein hydrolase activator NlpD